jgi:hypothetical protein
MEKLLKSVRKIYEDTEIWGHIFWNNSRCLIPRLRQRTYLTETLARWTRVVNVFLMINTKNYLYDR